MSSRIVAIVRLAGSRDPYHCASDDETSDPEVALEEAYAGEVSVSDEQDLVCAGGLTSGEWGDIAATSPEHESVVALCTSIWCAPELNGRSACVLRASVEEWRDLGCPVVALLNIGEEAPLRSTLSAGDVHRQARLPAIDPPLLVGETWCVLRSVANAWMDEVCDGGCQLEEIGEHPPGEPVYALTCPAGGVP